VRKLPLSIAQLLACLQQLERLCPVVIGSHEHAGDVCAEKNACRGKWGMMSLKVIAALRRPPVRTRAVLQSKETHGGRAP
jgi:hypothetical protein